MTYKVKSLVYFICFVAASVLHYTIVEEETISTEYAKKTELVKTDSNQISSTELLLEDDVQ